MATTTLLQRHAGEGETIAEAIRDCLDYGKDPEKTESGKYISAYECDPATVADEFLFSYPFIPLVLVSGLVLLICLIVPIWVYKTDVNLPVVERLRLTE